MQANWSLILNVLLLVGVIIAISRLMKARRQIVHQTSASQAPNLGKPEPHHPRGNDDIIAVRKVVANNPLPTQTPEHQPAVNATVVKTPAISLEKEEVSVVQENKAGKHIMLFLQAKENRQLAGYELLQTVLAAGLRFGEGQLFHRYQQTNGQGAILFSLAAATPTGTFDLQNIGGFSVKGLCLFMQTSGNSTIDTERFNLMIETAKQLSDGLDTKLLDDQQRPLTDAKMQQYTQIING